MKIKYKFILFGTLLVGSSAANAADGCKFLLCMGAANPMGIAECAGTVKEVLHDLAKGHPLPTCKMANGLDTKTQGSYVSYRRAGSTPSCPKDTRQGIDGVEYHAGAKPKNIRYSPFNGWTNLGEGSTNIKGQSLFSKDDYTQRICVGGSKLGSIAATTSYSENQPSNPPHEWWSSLQVMKPDGATYEFDFFVDNQLYSTHRF